MARPISTRLCGTLIALLAVHAVANAQPATLRFGQIPSTMME